MVEVEVLVPQRRFVDARGIVSDLAEARRSLRPFDEHIVSFVGDLSRRLRKDPVARTLPAVSALAFWIRPANIERLRVEWTRLNDARSDVRLVPRGVVFHMPPTNVDTLFVYSWVLSALVGNANLVRVSANAGEDAGVLLSSIDELLRDHSAIASTTRFVRYGHDVEITEALSSADVRVIWGGDETIRAVRRVPLNPHATELSFADRYSMCALDAQAVVDLDESALDDLVRHFYNDAYWFDQLGCSSPRAVFWKGDEPLSRRARDRFVDVLAKRVAIEGYDTATGAFMAKLVQSSALAADGLTTSVTWRNPDLTIVEQPACAELNRASPGGGMFSFRRIDRLTDISEVVGRRDQTLSHFGFGPDELSELVTVLNGVGLDRIVPVGKALQFGRYWDGHDLLDAFCRRVAIESIDRNATS